MEDKFGYFIFGSILIVAGLVNFYTPLISSLIKIGNVWQGQKTQIRKVTIQFRKALGVFLILIGLLFFLLGFRSSPANSNTTPLPLVTPAPLNLTE